jgi:hypothetical protein
MPLEVNHKTPVIDPEKTFTKTDLLLEYLRLHPGDIEGARKQFGIVPLTEDENRRFEAEYTAKFGPFESPWG